jgi:hypothetical protein
LGDVEVIAFQLVCLGKNSVGHGHDNPFLDIVPIAISPWVTDIPYSEPAIYIMQAVALFKPVHKAYKRLISGFLFFIA